VFGEFDAIIASPQNIYLVESKWDNLVESKKDELVIRREQLMRHQIFIWYLTHWKKKYSSKWADFIEEQQSTFNFGRKTIAPANSLLARNLEFVLDRLLERCGAFSSDNNVKNILLFFYRGESKAPLNINEAFTPIAIDYGKEVLGNCVLLWHVSFCCQWSMNMKIEDRYTTIIQLRNALHHVDNSTPGIANQSNCINEL
jgi:hypothetical protein